MLAGEVDPSVFIDSSLLLILDDDERVFKRVLGKQKGKGGHGGPSRGCCLSLKFIDDGNLREGRRRSKSHE